MWQGLEPIIKPVLNSLLIGLGGFSLAFLASYLLNRLLVRPMGAGWSKFVSSLVALAIGIWTITLILDSAGAAGLVVILVTAVTGAFAIGSERLAGDLVSGINLFITRTYAVGDMVLIAGYEGRVFSISLMMTILDTVHGDRVFIRNSEVANGIVINYSILPGHLISVEVPLPVSRDLDLAVSVIEKSIQGFSLETEKLGLKPTVLVESSAFGMFTIKVRAYVPERLDYGPEKTRLYLLACKALKDAGISM